MQKEFSNNVVLGIEGKYDFLSTRRQKISPYANNNDTASVKIKNIATILQSSKNLRLFQLGIATSFFFKCG